MARNQNWNKEWRSYIDGLSRLRWIPNMEDSKRIADIQVELQSIVDKNTEVSQ